jgi:hypothetical protein
MFASLAMGVARRSELDRNQAGYIELDTVLHIGIAVS